MSKGVMKVKKGKKCAIDVPVLMIEKRSRLSLQYIFSHFMIKVKRRTFVNGTFQSLSRGRLIEVQSVR